MDQSFFFLLFFQHHLALSQTGIEIMFGNFLVHQVLMAIDTGCNLLFAFSGGRPWQTRRVAWYFVARPAGHAVPPLQLHARPVGRLQPSLVEFLDRRVVNGELIYEERQSIHHVRPDGEMEVLQALRNVAVLAARVRAERTPVR